MGLIVVRAGMTGKQNGCADPSACFRGHPWPCVRYGDSSEGLEFHRVGLLGETDALRQVRSNRMNPNSPFDCCGYCLEPEVRLGLQTRKFGTDAPQFRRQVPVVNRR